MPSTRKRNPVYGIWSTIGERWHEEKTLCGCDQLLILCLPKGGRLARARAAGRPKVGQVSLARAATVFTVKHAPARAGDFNLSAHSLSPLH